jgi:GT2 family glycosyltransferase
MNSHNFLTPAFTYYIIRPKMLHKSVQTGKSSPNAMHYVPYINTVSEAAAMAPVYNCTQIVIILLISILRKLHIHLIANTAVIIIIIIIIIIITIKLLC